MRHSLRTDLSLTALVVIIALGLGCARRGHEAAAEAPAEPPELAVVQPEVRPLDLTIPITGSLLSTVQVDVRTEVAGRLIQAPPREGDFVAKGQVLARLDDSNHRLA